MNDKSLYSLECIGCLSSFRPGRIYACPKCGELLQIVYNYKSVRRRFHSAIKGQRPLSVWRYEEILPVDGGGAVTLVEGGTGLPRSVRLAKSLNLPHLYFKNEGQNPTGSFKDRGMTVAVTRAIEIGVKEVLCASTGNTSASIAAYAARAGLKATVLVPRGKIAKGKLLQAVIHGAHIEQVRGNFDKALQLARRKAESGRSYLVNSLNPYRIEGQKTLAFEVWEQLGHSVPDAVILPVGNAGNISAIWKGFQELNRLKLTRRAPRMIGIQASGAAPIAQAYARRSDTVTTWSHPETVASAICIGAPASWKKALRAVRESGGTMLTVSDSEILRAQHLLAESEGIFAEPASAASVAGLQRLSRSSQIRSTDCVVCVITGHGLKDPNIT